MLVRISQHIYIYVGASTLRATAAREFELAGTDKAGELSLLGKIIGEAAERKLAHEPAGAKVLEAACC
jgi:hypothetical protein